MKWTLLIGWYEIHDHKNVNRSVSSWNGRWHW